MLLRPRLLLRPPSFLPRHLTTTPHLLARRKPEAPPERARIVVDDEGKEKRMYPEPLPLLGWDGKEVNEGAGSDTVERIVSPRPRKARVTKKVAVAQEGSGESAEPEVLYTPLERAVRANLAKYPDALLLTQVGTFFESYFEQAREICQILNIKLTSKVFGKTDNTKNRHPFAGFPLSQLDKYVSVLISEGKKVVIVEEFKERGDSTIRRKVTRVVTPGTGVDQPFVHTERMNYILALGVVGGKSVTEQVGMAYRDVSTGASFTRTTTLSDLRDDIRLVQPKEVVIDEALASSKLGKRVVELLEGEKRRENLLFSVVSTDAVASTSAAVRSPSTAAEDVLLAYLAKTFPSTPLRRSKTTHVDPASVMHLDAVTLQSLEIRESLRGGVKGSLFGAVNRTVTRGGMRLLQERLCNPSTDIAIINCRLDLISSFVGPTPSQSVFRSTLSLVLKTLDDTPRLLQRLSLGRPNAANDLLGLKRTMQALAQLKATIRAHQASREGGALAAEQRRALEELLERLGEYDVLVDEIGTAVDERALIEREEREERKREVVTEFGETAWEKQLAEEEKERSSGSGETKGVWGAEQPWVIRFDFNDSLASSHATLLTLRQRASALASSLREKYRSPTLTLKHVPKIGPALHMFSRDGVSKLEADPAAMQVQKTGSTRVYVVQEWVDLWISISKVQEKIIELEKDAMDVLVARTLERYNDLLETSNALAELDVTLSFADLASAPGWVRPIIDNSKSLHIVAGRHPTVENALRAQQRVFDPNDVRFAHPDDKSSTSPPSLVHVITGPNMAGKSTFLRLTALLTILAQSGSFVPASSATLGVVDRVFSRVGARDELDRDRSTFAVEMDETVGILRGATTRSLVLMDELGRGTSPLDGISLAYSVLLTLAQQIRCRTLFATHFHRLGAALEYDAKRERCGVEGVEFWCTDVRDDGKAVQFPHTIRRGLNPDSGGLTIARLAGFPENVLEVARGLREELKKEGGGGLL